VVKNGGLCMLASGGIDSAVALAESAQSAESVIPLYVRSGLVWERAEIYWLNQWLQTLDNSAVAPLEILDLPVADLYGEHWSLTGVDPPDDRSPDEATYLPGRNILLLAKAGVYAAMNNCRAIVLGPLAANPFPDATPTFFEAMATAIGHGMGLDDRLPIETPLVGLTKPEVVRRGTKYRLDLTFSCLDPTPEHQHCGVCNKCAERQQGFREAGVDDPTSYATNDSRTSESTSRFPRGSV
jgi:7-cyano-7-deazaguanine synthase